MAKRGTTLSPKKKSRHSYKTQKRLAIKNAKDTAAQFAKESSSRLGGVARGNQGVFDITDKDPGSPEFKKIRVVSTLRFLLNN